MMFARRPKLYKPPGRGREAGSHQAGLSRLSRLSPAQRRRIADMTGCRHADAATLVDHLSRGEVVRALLKKLSPEGLVLTRLLLEATDLLPRQVAETEARARLGDLAHHTFKELEQKGLLLSTRWAGGAELIGLVPPLPRSARAYLWLLGDSRSGNALPVSSGPSRASLGIESMHSLVLALAAVASEPPRMAKDGTLHTSDVARLHADRLQAAIEDADELKCLIERMLALGLLACDSSGRAGVRWKRAEAFADLSAASRLPLLLSTEPDKQKSNRSLGLASPGHMRRLIVAGLSELPEGWWARRSAMMNAVRMRVLAADAMTPYANTEKVNKRAVAQIRHAMNKLSLCFDVHDEGHGTWVRLPRSEIIDQSSRWLVQPDHEIVVPPEIPLGELSRLASVADLVQADVVTLFRVGPESIERGVRAGLEADTILERLTSRADGGLPEGMDIQVRDWVRHVGTRPAGVRAPDEEAESLVQEGSSAEQITKGTGERKHSHRRGKYSSSRPAHLSPPAPPIPISIGGDASKSVSSFREELARLLGINEMERWTEKEFLRDDPVSLEENDSRASGAIRSGGSQKTGRRSAREEKREDEE